MKAHDNDLFKYIKDFLTIYLPKQKCYSSKTIESYKTAINLLLDFLKDEKGIPTLNISFEHMNYTMILEFLDWLQDFRNCSTSTRNQRLMALKNLFLNMPQPLIRFIFQYNWKLVKFLLKRHQKR